MNFGANISSPETKFSVAYKLLTIGGTSDTNNLVPVYNIVSIQSFSAIMLTEFPVVTTGQPSVVSHQESHMVTCILAILGVLLVIAIIVSLVSYCFLLNQF